MKPTTDLRTVIVMTMKIKFFLIFGLFLINNSIFAQITPISIDYRDKIVSGIYKIEGGAKTKYPFGIKSIDTGGDYAKAKRICENTVQNNYIRWQKAGKTNEFLFFLADRYCPQTVDKQGNTNWKKNIKIFVDPKD